MPLTTQASSRFDEFKEAVSMVREIGEKKHETRTAENPDSPTPNSSRRIETTHNPNEASSNNPTNFINPSNLSNLNNSHSGKITNNNSNNKFDHLDTDNLKNSNSNSVSRPQLPGKVEAALRVSTIHSKESWNEDGSVTVHVAKRVDDPSLVNPAQSKTVLARNLPRDITAAELRALFGQYGAIRDVYVPKNADRKSIHFGTIKGFALVKYHTAAESTLAYLALEKGLCIRGNAVALEFAKKDRT